MSCKSYLTIDEGDGWEDSAIALNCERHGVIHKAEIGWERSISAEHLYAVWLKHLGEQS